MQSDSVEAQSTFENELSIPMNDHTQQNCIRKDTIREKYLQKILKNRIKSIEELIEERIRVY